MRSTSKCFAGCEPHDEDEFMGVDLQLTASLRSVSIDLTETDIINYFVVKYNEPIIILDSEADECPVGGPNLSYIVKFWSTRTREKVLTDSPHLVPTEFGSRATVTAHVASRELIAACRARASSGSEQTDNASCTDS